MQSFNLEENMPMLEGVCPSYATIHLMSSESVEPVPAELHVMNVLNVRFYAACTGALKHDRKLSQWLPKLVPKRFVLALAASSAHALLCVLPALACAVA